MVNILEKLGLRPKAASTDQEQSPVRDIPLSAPINKANLLREEATPSLTSVRTIQHQYSSAGLEPQRLGMLMRDAEEGRPQAWLEIAEQIEEKDGHIVGVFGQRKRAVTSLDITVESAGDDPLSEEIAAMVRDWIDRDELRSDLFDIMDAVGKGYSVNEIIWNNDDPNRWTIERIEWRDPRWFEFDRIDGRTLKLRSDGGHLVDLTPNKYIVHQVKAKSGLMARSGVMRPVSWYWLYKNFSVRDWVIFAEAYGQPLRVGKYSPGSSEEDRRVLLRAVSQLGSDAGAIIPDSMNIEFIKDGNPTGSVDLFERLARYCDEQISKAVLGQTTTTDALSGGGLAGNQSHNDVRGDIADDDAAALAATLNRFLVRPLVEINYGKQKKYPRIRIRRPESVDATAVRENVTTMTTLGARVSVKRTAEILGVPLAENGEDALTAPAAPMGAPVFASAQHRCGNLACTGHTVTAAAKARPGDGIDELADELAGEWEELLTPLEEEIQKAVASAKDFDELETKLLALAAVPGGDVVVDRLQKAIFSARLAGNLGVKLDE